MVRSRYVVVLTILLAVVAGMALARGFEWTAIKLNVTDPLLLGEGSFRASGLLGFVIAFAAGGVVLFHPRIAGLADEVADELTKVTWPDSDETWGATKVVIVAVILSTLILGGLDWMWLNITTWIMTAAVAG